MSLFLLIFTLISFAAGFAIDFFNVEQLLQGVFGLKPSYGPLALVMVFNGLTLQYLASQGLFSYTRNV